MSVAAAGVISSRRWISVSWRCYWCIVWITFRLRLDSFQFLLHINAKLSFVFTQLMYRAEFVELGADVTWMHAAEILKHKS